MTADPREREKRAAAREAAGLVQPGETVAVGSGSTARRVLDELAARLGELRGWRLVVGSREMERHARRRKLPLVPLEDVDRFSLMIDGADEVAPDLTLIKGGGGAHLREKVLARMSDRLFIVVDPSKIVRRWGERSPLPLEVVPFTVPFVARQLKGRNLRPSLRMAPVTGPGYRPREFVTDNGNRILDVRLPEDIEDIREFEEDLRGITGVIETGLFIGLTHRVLVGRSDGRVDVLAPHAGAALPTDERAGIAPSP
jgi:ribose 5-phosphate isomerase A